MIITVPENKKIVNEAFNFSKLKKNNDEFVNSQFNKIYEETLKDKVIQFLEYYNVQNYDIFATGNGLNVDVYDHLYLPNKNLREFKLFKFNKVTGDCNLSGNKFTDFTQFPKYILGNCIANNNYIKNFKGIGLVKGELLACKQKVKTDYILNTDNYLKYKNNLLECNVYVKPIDKIGKVVNILNENYCIVNINNNFYKFKTNEVEIV